MILPTKIDVSKAQANQRKIEIDNGVALARQIDSLRSTFAQERIAHETWKKSSIETLNRQLEGLQDGIDAKKREIVDLDEQRRKLLEPLNKEWENVNAEKENVRELRLELFLDQERHKENVNLLENSQNEIVKALKRAKQNEDKTEKALINVEELEESKQQAYRQSLEYTNNQKLYHQSRQQDIENLAREYEVALKTIEIREQEVKDKESELLERELLLKDRIAMHERNLTRI